MTNLQTDPVKEGEVHKKSFLGKLLLIVFILLVLGVLFYFFKDKIIRFLPFISKYQQSTVASKSEPSSDNPFGEIVDKQKNQLVEETDFSKIDVGFKEEIGNLINKTGTLADWGMEWNWETSWVFGKVMSLEDNKVEISFIKPDRMQDQVREFDSFCEKEKTVLLSRENLVILDADVDIKSAVQPGYLIYTHCLDAECLKLGNGCVVVKMF